MVHEEPNDLTARIFAYGSNMCSGRFRDYGVHPQKAGIAAVLHDHRLCFNKLSRKDCSGKANVEPHEGTDVWGVLYEIPEHELPGLVQKKRVIRHVACPSRLERV
jgi:cation transport regulator ChaC